MSADSMNTNTEPYNVEAYCDDTSDGKGELIFIVATVLGPASEWRAMEPKWLELCGGRTFHATDCASGRGEFTGLTLPERFEISMGLSMLLAETRLLGYAVGHHLQAAKECFPGRRPEWSFFACTSKVIAKTADLTALLKPAPSLVSFTFDRRRKTESNCKYLYEQMVQNRSIVGTERFDPKARFSESKHSVGVQAADLWAFETRRRVMGLRFDSKEDAREQIKVLGLTNRFELQFFDDGYFRDLKARFPEICESQGMNPQEYFAELESKNRQHDDRSLIEYAFRKNPGIFGQAFLALHSSRRLVLPLKLDVTICDIQFLIQIPECA